MPWRKPWTGGQLPANMVTKHPYNGVNFLMTYGEFDSPWYLTIKQVLAKGGRVKADEMKNSTPIVYMKFGEHVVENEDGETETKPYRFMRYYRVWNLSQCEGIEPPASTEEVFEHKPIEAAETLVKTYGATIKHKQQRAFYRPSDDVVNMPKKTSFKQTEEYYSVLFHELTHHTGHKSRLNRLRPDFFGGHEYSKEELVAEFGASFLCAELNIINKTVDNSAAYIQSWLKALQNDRKLLISAASKAKKAVRHIKGEAQYEDRKEFKKAA